MLKIYDVIKTIMDKLSKVFLVCLFGMIFLVSLFIKAMYHFDDFPYFVHTEIADVICLLCVVCIMICFIRARIFLQNHTNCIVGFVLFMGAAVLYFYLVPVRPFSDMTAIYNGAMNFSHFKIDDFLADEYWKQFASNIYLSVFWGILLIPLPKSLMTLKILNALFAYGTIYLTKEIAKYIGVKFYNLVYWCMLTFISFFLYTNCVYAEMPLIFFLVLAILIYVRSNNIILSFCVLGIARYLRTNASIVVVAIIFCYLFKYKPCISNKDGRIRILKLFLGVICFVSVQKLTLGIVHSALFQPDFKGYPKWNMYYIGLNEEEFGFMNGDFSYDRTFQDVVNRVKEYGPVRVGKILTKKTFWLWSQGTYQAQRYAFGVDANTWQDKFIYETFFTKYLLRDDQLLRRILNSFMRAQYLVFFMLMIASICKSDSEKFRLFRYIFMATALVMIVYELKSRFIISLLPMMIIMACDALPLGEMKKQNNSLYN